MKKNYSLFCIRTKSKKIAMTLGFLSFFFTSMASVKTTVADGNWFDPLSWSPAGVPLTEDTVLVNHDMTASGNKVEFSANWLIIKNNKSVECDSIFSLHGNIRLHGSLEAKNYVNGDGDSTLIYGILIADSCAIGNTTAINYGTINADFFATGSDFENRGLLDLAKLYGGGSEFTNFSSAAIVVSDTTIFSTAVLNQANATMVMGYLLTDSTLTNDGDITAASWAHLFGVADGTGGRFCISDCFQNFSDIEGTIDICDATPDDGVCDWQFGNIAGTVTYCNSGSCKNNLGIEESDKAVSVYPNPGYDRINIANGVVGSTYRLVDVQGKIVHEGFVSSEIFQIDLTELDRGIYFLQMQHQDQVSVTKFFRN